MFEECDDGNEQSGDGCYNCHIETGWKCTGEQPEISICTCAPILIKPQYSNKWKQIHIQFDREIKISNSNSDYTPQMLCLYLFPYDLIAKLGTNPNCEIKGSIIIIELGENTTLTNISTIYINNGIILGKEDWCNMSFNMTENMTIDSDITDLNMAPELQIDYPKEMNPCSPLLVKLMEINNLGRRIPSEIGFTCVEIKSNNSSNYFNDLQSKNELNVELGRISAENIYEHSAQNIQLFSGGTLHIDRTFTFEAHIINFLNIETKIAFKIKTMTQPAPNMQIEGLSNDIFISFTYLNLVFRAIAQIAICNNNNNNNNNNKAENMEIEYEWIINEKNSPSVNIIIGENKNNEPRNRVMNAQYLYIPSYTLTPGKTYIIRVRGWSRENPENIGEHTSKINIQQSQLISIITGGNREHPKEQMLNISGGLSYDPDNKSQELAFEWICNNLTSNISNNSPCEEFPSNSEDLRGNKSLIFEGNYFKSPDLLKFTLTVNRANNTNNNISTSSTSFIQIQLINRTNTPIVELYVNKDKHQGIYINRKEETTVRANAKNSPLAHKMGFRWIIQPPITKEKYILGIDENNTTNNNKILKLKVGALEHNTEYIINCIGEYGENNTNKTQYITANILLKVRESPNIKLFNIYPNTGGFAYKTQFELLVTTTENNIFGDPYYLYSYQYMKNSTNVTYLEDQEWIFLNQNSHSKQLTTLLPDGNPNNGHYLLNLRVIVKDNYGATNIFYQTVEVKPTSGVNINTVGLFIDLISEITDTDIGSAFNVIYIYYIYIYIYLDIINDPE